MSGIREVSPAAAPDRHPYAHAPCYPELAAITLVGLAHIVLETSFSEPVALWFSGGVSLAFLGYLVWRARDGAVVLRAWGMRRDNFWPAIQAQAVFGAAGAAAMLAYAVVAGSVALPWGFWLTLAFYPIWGVTQQFALQNLIARNVAGFIVRPVGVAGVAAVLFAASHIPRWPLVSLTFISGFFFTVIYRRVPNLWAVGIVHGFLGSLAIYLVSSEDPWAVIWSVVAGH